MEEIKPRPPWNSDFQVLKNDLRWYQDEMAMLETNIKRLEVELFDKQREIEELMEEIERLRNDQ